MVQRTRDLINEFSIFLLMGTAAALIWAGVGHHSYEEMKHWLHFAVNDVLMCFFFALAAKEVWESFLPGGKLDTWPKRLLPAMATLGGVVVPAALFAGGCLIVQQPSLLRGWAIPCATDIAFSALVARIVFGKGHAAVTFLILLAILDDAAGLIIIAIFYPSPDATLLQYLWLGLAVAAVLIGFGMRRLGLHSFWWYLLIPGLISWVSFYLAGIHPALALVPIIPTLPHAKTDLGLFARRELGRHDTLSELEHFWRLPVDVILGLFGLVNAGVVFSSVGTMTALVLVGLLVGKPLGIMLFTLLGMIIGMRINARLPEGTGLREVFVLGMAAAIGFTVSLFVSTVALPTGATLDAAKMGALFSFGAVVPTFIAAKLLRVRRVNETFTTDYPPRPVAEPATTEA